MAQAIVWQVPNLARGVVDSSAGTLTYQIYDTSSSSYVTQWTLDFPTGNITVAQSATITKSLTVDGTSTLSTTDMTSATVKKSFTVDGTSTVQVVKSAVSSQSVTGTTAGSFTWVMPLQGSALKEVLIYFDGYENDTTTAQTVTYPTAFTDTPNIDNPSSVGGLSTDTTHLTINPDSTSKYTGWVKVWGF